MALTNDEKAFLAKMVKRDIITGSTVNESCLRNRKYGYKESTIRQYYKALKNHKCIVGGRHA